MFPDVMNEFFHLKSIYSFEDKKRLFMKRRRQEDEKMRQQSKLRNRVWHNGFMRKKTQKGLKIVLNELKNASKISFLF